ncbi:hypothetical protein WIW50_07620 [Flavobacteriaceae bacterium 3-367]
MKKQRSASYPPHTLDYSLEFTEKVYKNFGNTYRSKREDIASALNVGVGTLNNKISASVQYGLIDVKPKEGYKVTDLFVRCYRPLNADDKILALREAFQTPKLYKTLIEVFEGNVLPPARPLSNILLHNHYISEVGCERAAKIFEENVETLGYLKDGRVFSFDPSIEFEEVVDPEVEELGEKQIPPPPVSAVPPTPTPTIPATYNEQPPSPDNNGGGSNIFTGSEPIPHNIPLKGKLPAQLLLPHDVGGSDFDFIIAYIGLIRQQYT